MQKEERTEIDERITQGEEESVVTVTENTMEIRPSSKDHSPVAPAQDDISHGKSDTISMESSCGTGACGDSNSHVYAIGTIQARFPSMGVEKEFVQAVKEGETSNLTNQQALYKILSQEDNRYLAREVCWVFTIENLDTYIIQPKSETELTHLIEAIKPVKGVDCDVIIGMRGPIAPPEMCNGLQVPIVLCDRIYSFNVDDFINAIPKPKSMKDATFKEAAQELFLRIMQMADNAGEMDEHRAVNYVALRYPAIYAQTMEMYAADKSLSGVDVRPSRISGTRRIVQVIFSYVDRNTDVPEKYFTRVDVTEKWPFLVTKLQPFYDR